MKVRPSLLLASFTALAAFASAPTRAAERLLVSDDFTRVAITGARASQEAVSGKNLYANLGANDVFAGSGPALAINGVWAAGYVSFPPVTLAAAGDTLTLTLNIRYPAAPPSVGGGLRLGLYDCGQDPAALFPYNKTTNPAGDRAKGYFVTVNPGGTDNTNLYRDPGNQSATKGLAVFSTASENRIIGFSGAVFGSETRTVVVTLTLTDAGLDFTGSIAGTPFAIKRPDLVGAPVTRTFDTFVFGAGNHSGPYLIEKFTVTTNAASGR